MAQFRLKTNVPVIDAVQFTLGSVRELSEFVAAENLHLELSQDAATAMTGTVTVADQVHAFVQSDWVTVSLTDKAVSVIDAATFESTYEVMEVAPVTVDPAPVDPAPAG